MTADGLFTDSDGNPVMPTGDAEVRVLTATPATAEAEAVEPAAHAERVDGPRPKIRRRYRA